MPPNDVFMLEYGSVLYVDVHVLAHEGTIRRGVEFLAPVFGTGLFRPFGGEVVEGFDGTDFEDVIVGGVALLCGLLLTLKVELAEVVGDAVFVEVVVGIDEAVGGVFVGVETAPYVFGDKLDGFAHEFVVVDMAFVVDVVDYDVVGTVFAFARSTGGLPEADGGEFYSVGGGKVSVCPVAKLEAVSVVVDDALVVLQLCLQG